MIWLFLLCFFGKIIKANEENVSHDPEIMAIGESNFTEVFQFNTLELFILEFYSPICGYCQAFIPEYAKIGRELSGIALLTKAKVETEKALADKFKVESVPGILLFIGKNEVPFQFEGKKKADKIIDWITIHAPVFELGTPDSVSQFLNAPDDSTIKRQLLVYGSPKPPKQFQKKKMDPFMHCIIQMNRNLKEINCLFW